MSQILVTGEAKIRDIQGPVVANSGVITALDGAASQYVRGDGTLADFPTSTGGGSSVSYYLNGSVNQGTFAGSTYYEMSKSPIIGAGTDFPVSTNGLVAQFITDANDPDLLEVPGGNFNVEFYFSVNNNTGNPTVYAELYKYDGTTFTLLGSSQAIPESINQGTTIAPYYFAIPVGTAALALTDRIAIRIYANVDGRTVTLHTENSHLCQVVTTFSKGMISLNNLTDQSQFITTGTSGTNFNIVSSGDTHTFNLPVASATNTGKLSNTDWSTFNNKVPYTGATGDVNLGLYNISAQNAFLNGVSGVNGGNLFLKQDIDFGQSAGYTTLYSTGKNLGFVSYVGSFTYNALFSLNSLTNNSTRTYTLPDSSGTLALTSNLSAYVPYTGATGNVDLGLFGLTSNAVKAIGDNSTYGGVISIKQNNVIGGLIGTGYTELFGKTNRLGISFGAGSIAYLSNSVLTAERTYTLPDATGTLALTSNLSSYVPYTGATDGVDLGIYNIFSSFVYAEGAGGSTNGGILIKQYSGALASNSGYTSLFATPNQLGINFSGVYNTFLQSGTLTASRTYTLPDLSGTLALLEGTQTFSGSKTFSVTTIQDAGIVLKDGVYPTPSTGYVGFASNGAGVTIVRRSGVTSYNNNFQFPLSSNDYNFPNITGTVALLEGTQTFTGVKSFDTGILLKNGVVTTTSGYTGIGAGTSGINVSLGSGGGGLLIFQSTSYNYTFPAATGTIALTSDLTTYVPYTGATANVDLGIRALFAQNIVVGQTSTQGYIHFKTGGSTALSADTSQAPYGTNGMIYSFDQTGGNYKQFVIDSSSLTNNTIRTYTMPNASGTLALTSDLGAYLPLTGGTLTGALSGTSAGLSSTLSAMGTNIQFNLDGTFGANYYTMGFGGVSNGFNRISGGTGTTDGLYITSATGRDIVFRTNGSASNTLVLLSTGAATFSSATMNIGTSTSRGNVTIEQTTTNAGLVINSAIAESPKLYLRDGGGAGYSELQANNNLYLNASKVGIGTSSPSTLLHLNATTTQLTLQNTDGGANAERVGMFMTGGDTFKLISLNDNNTTRVDNILVANVLNGNVGIGTSSPNAQLDVSTTARFHSSSNWMQFQQNVLTSQNTDGAHIRSVVSADSAPTYSWAGDTDTGMYTPAANTIAFSTGATERMRITSGGNVLIGATSSASDTRLFVKGSTDTSSAYALIMQSANGTDLLYVNNVGTGYLKASAWSYGSDKRIKENINYIETGLDKVLALKPATFDYIDGVKNNIGWIAQDVQEVIPEAVGTISETNDQLTLKSDFIVPYLVKAIQELEARIKQLENK